MPKLEKIEDCNFFKCLNLTNLLLPKLEIMNNAFYECINLKELDLPVLIKCNGFHYCRKLKKLDLPKLNLV